MTTYGVTETGFVKKTLEVILDDFTTKQRDRISPILDTSSDTPIGQLNGVVGEALAEVWDLAEAVYRGMDPDQNTGDAQDAVCAITGVRREAATATTVKATLNLNDGTTVPAGSLATVEGAPGTVFVLQADATNATGVTANVTNTVWACRDTGPIQCLAGKLTVIQTPISGWNSITNPADGVVGKDAESPAALRTRRRAELGAQGTSPVDAIRGDLLQVVGVVSANVLENTTDLVDANGLPPHTVEVIIYDGISPAVSDDDLAQAIFEAKAAGIGTFGNTTGTATDANGDTHAISFTRAVQRNVYLTIGLKPNPRTYAGATAVKAAAVATAAYEPGDDVILAAYYASTIPLGVLDLSYVKAGFSASPTGTANLSIGLREIAILDSSRIVVVEI